MILKYLLGIIYNPFKQIPQYLQHITKKQAYLIILLFIIISGVFAYYPMSLLDKERNSPIIINVLSFVLFLTLNNFLYSVIIDIICDFRIVKKQLLHFLLVTLGISTLSSLFVVVVSIICLMSLPHTKWLLYSLVILVVWWQWFVEAVSIKIIYGKNLLLSFVLEVVARVFLTAISFILFNILAGEVSMLKDYVLL
ncbi:MAG: hypothetical protein A2W05_09435 [Candidatus Schekmanbacteria bacterium RBG_16_38_10]|uniref:Yip1 domain-containing protein n=1 Tax=Candidatus Schekmanbacteria bacterium RBG_16_38_10 TaxID=1817879 RepID=A0A1F7S1U9_9BACT|nr:MAG: hypothetical protein A2W05_09435 [Candidatus Schekmanbacteria bacterium RBG_16_38_10]